MIYIDRNAVPVPEILRETSQRKSYAQTRLQAEIRNTGIHNTVFDKRIYADITVRESLESLFKGKCAYCETYFAASGTGDIEHFRPKNRAMNFNGKVDDFPYSWLAYEWSNLYIACSICNRNKANRFPIKGNRATCFEELEQEEALLIDPCKASDFTVNHLLFQADGSVLSNSEKGQASIDVLGLNRTSLIYDRKRVIEMKVRELNTVKGILFSEDSRGLESIILENILKPTTAYLSAIRQTVRHWFEQNITQLSTELTPQLLDFLFKEDNIEVSPRQLRSMSKKATIASKEQFSVESDKKRDKELFFKTARWIERIEIKNFKSIDKISIDFSKEHNEHAPWMVLLGENGVGKSSVLQAVALALMGQRKANDLGLNPKSFINRYRKSKSASVTIHLTNTPEPVSLYIDDSSDGFKITPPEPSVILMGYGSTRLFNNKTIYKERVRIKNLFDPLEQLNNVEKWLADPKEVKKGQFIELANWLKQLLLLDNQAVINRHNGKIAIRLRPQGPLIELNSLSDGFKSVLALALDIMMTLADKWESVQDAEGIVLIDEIETHLHPRWKMQFVSRMREVFPRVRFLVTTHDPLCLRGLHKGEIVLMDLDEKGKVRTTTDLPDPTDLRVDQLLTSPFFGLNTLMDASVELDFDEYYKLLANPQLSNDQKKQLAILKSKLKHKNQLGSSLREELMYDTIDKVVASYKTKFPKENLISEETSNRLAELWRKAGTDTNNND